MVHLTVTGLQLRRRNPESWLPPKNGFPDLGVSSASSEFLTLSEDNAPESRKPVPASAPQTATRHTGCDYIVFLLEGYDAT